MPDQTSLATLIGGSTIARFDEALVEAIKNLIDPNCDWKSKRVVTLKLELKAATENRDVVSAVVKVETKLAQPEPAATTMFVGRTRKGFVLTEHNPQQEDLPMPTPTVVQGGA